MKFLLKNATKNIFITKSVKNGENAQYSISKICENNAGKNRGVSAGGA